MSALRVVGGGVPRVLPHAGAPQQTETWSELDAWLQGRITHAESYLDGEVAQSIGWELQLKHRARLDCYREVAAKIAHLVAAEADERAERAHVDSIEQQYKEAYGPDADKLATWQAEGR